MFCSACGTQVAEGSLFCGQCGASQNSTVSSTKTGADGDKLLVLLAHLGGIFFGFIPSLIVFLIRKDEPGITLDNAREALNWQITVIISSIACFFLSFILIGLLLFWVLVMINVVLCIVGAVKSSPTKVYRYPFAIRLLKA